MRGHWQSTRKFLRRESENIRTLDLVKQKTLMAAKRGLFFVLEGIDRTGKTTQAARLVESMAAKGHSVKAMRFPDRTTASGKVLSDYLKQATEVDDAAIHLLFSANRWEARGSLLAALNAGTHVFVDRYAYSGVVFSAMKDKMPLTWCMGPDAGLPRPDHVLWLDMPVEEAAKRGDYGEERYENIATQLKVQGLYGKLCDETHWHKIDASPDPDTVAESLSNLVTSLISKGPETEEPPILWPHLWDASSSQSPAIG